MFFLIYFLSANFTLPSNDFGWFDEVIYTELNEEEAKKKVEEFNEKGKKAVKERERDTDRGDRRRGMNQLTLECVQNNCKTKLKANQVLVKLSHVSCANKIILLFIITPS